jgi:hypothetical protein
MGQRTSVYLEDDLHTAAKASGIPLAELVRRGLAANTAPPAQAQVPAAAPLGTLDDGEPSPGVLYAGPGCFQRDTREYGLRQLPLCTACAAALISQAYQRELPPGAARALQRRRSA